MIESRTLCVNANRYFHRFKSEEVPPSVDLLYVLEKQKELPKCYWKDKDGSEVASWGAALTLHSVPKFDSGNDSPAIFWGGHAFSSIVPRKNSPWSTFPVCTFFLPQYQLVRKEGSVTYITHAVNSPLPDSKIIEHRGSFKANPKFPTPLHSPSLETWKKLVEKALDSIGENDFEKVVMARQSTYKCSLNPYALLSQNQAADTTRFAIQFTDQATFIGATPEILYRREQNQAISEAIAGTCKRGKTATEDAKLGDQLLKSAKEKREFLFVKGSIEESLRPLCTTFSWEDKDQIIKTPTVQHLYNQIRGVLKPHVDDEMLLNHLHPTAAMGGAPKKSALEYLATHEPFERGWYASPIGFISQNHSAFAVAIRSALIEKKATHLFAGAGIVEGSEPEKEWEELENKSALWVGK